MFNALADLKIHYIDLKICKTITDFENSTLKKQVDKLDSLNLNLKYEVLKLSIVEKRKVTSED